MFTLKRNGHLQLLVRLEDVATTGSQRLDHAYLQIGVVEMCREFVLPYRSCKQHSRRVCVQSWLCVVRVHEVGAQVHRTAADHGGRCEVGLDAAAGRTGRV